MFSGYSFLVSLGYAVVTLGIVAFEARRTRRSGPDVISMFILLFVIQCCLPGIVMYACLPLVERSAPTDVQAFDRIYTAADLSTALTVLGLTAWFVIFFYGFTALNGRLLKTLANRPANESRLLISGSPLRLMTVLTLGLILSIASLYTLGSSLAEGYKNLILYRADLEGGQESVLVGFGFALSQCWTWLAVLALFAIYEHRGRGPTWFLCLSFLVAFVLFGVSRRAVFIPALLAYVTLVLFDHRWRAKWLLAVVIPLVLWIAFGKELIGIWAFNGTLADVTGRYETLSAAFLRAASDIGITVVESLGSISLLDIPPRFGVDHLLSVFRTIPTGHIWLGTMPERIVRLSTAAFASPQDEDIPPGLFGQMWMDFRVFGPVVWALGMSVQMSVLQHFYSLTVRTRQAVALFALVTFIVALPINTGSYDFTFSIDIYVLLICILLTFRFGRLWLPAQREPAVTRVADQDRA